MKGFQQVSRGDVSMTVIRAENLTKTFRVKRKAPGFWGSLQSLVKPDAVEKEAVRGISFRVEKGETVAFLGPNGAGKSTTIKMLTGILHPTSGRLEVLGMVPQRERVRLAFRIGTVFGQKSQLWYHLPPADTFALMADIYELPAKSFRVRRDELVERFGLGPHLHTPVRKLSLGERMRCEMAVALLHRPEILFLDEPTIGMDVVVKQKIREMIRLFNRKEGVTVFLTSHDAGDVEELCDRAIIINHGKVVMDVPVHQLKRDVLKVQDRSSETGGGTGRLRPSGDGGAEAKGNGVEVEGGYPEDDGGGGHRPPARAVSDSGHQRGGSVDGGCDHDALRDKRGVKRCKVGDLGLPAQGEKICRAVSDPSEKPFRLHPGFSDPDPVFDRRSVYLHPTVGSHL